LNIEKIGIPIIIYLIKRRYPEFFWKKFRKGVIPMVCETIKAGAECAFMTKKGCGFNGGSCHQIIDRCEGCNKIIEYTMGKYCMIYPDPASKWAIGGCPTASHIKKDAAARDQKINPLKASKRAARK
jgi:hypothetical protein